MCLPRLSLAGDGLRCLKVDINRTNAYRYHKVTVLVCAFTQIFLHLCAGIVLVLIGTDDDLPDPDSTRSYRLPKLEMGRKTTQQVLQSHPVPTNPAQYIAKVIENRGTSHEVVLSRDRAGEKVLVSLPTRFRKSIWIKKGNYAIIEIDSQPTTKIVGEIVHVLLPDNVKYLKSENLWPEEFLDAPDDTITKPESVPRSAQSDGSDDSDDDDDLFVNTNRPVYDDEESEEED